VMLAGSSARAKAELGWAPRYPTASAVIRRFREIAPRRLDRRLPLAFSLLRREGRRMNKASSAGPVHLCITGEYGGDVTLRASPDRISIRSGVPELPTSAIHLSSDLLCRILAGKADAETAGRTGDIRFDGNSDGRTMLEWLAGTFALLRTRGGIGGAAARRLARAFAEQAG
jgi:hypothetical protein